MTNSDGVSFARVRELIRERGGNFDTHQSFIAVHGARDFYRPLDVSAFLGSIAPKVNYLTKYATPGEAKAARAIIRKALAMGCLVSVHDGGEWTVRHSASFDTVTGALCTTEGDKLTIRHPDGRACSIYLIWGNDPDGSELVADHTDNDLAETLTKS